MLMLKRSVSGRMRIAPDFLCGIFQNGEPASTSPENASEGAYKTLLRRRQSPNVFLAGMIAPIQVYAFTRSTFASARWRASTQLRSKAVPISPTIIAMAFETGIAAR